MASPGHVTLQTGTSHETQGVVLLEAPANGVPVIVCDCTAASSCSWKRRGRPIGERA